VANTDESMHLSNLPCSVFLQRDQPKDFQSGFIFHCPQVWEKSGETMLNIFQECFVLDIVWTPRRRTTFQMWPDEAFIELNHQVHISVFDGLLNQS